MLITKEKQEQDAHDFADQFGQAETPKAEVSEDQAFGLASDPPAGDAAPAAATAEATAAPAAPADDAKAAEEARLRDWEAQLKAKEEELAAREATMQTANVGEKQTTTATADAGDPGSGDPGLGDQDDDDPAKRLAEDFGQEFVDLFVRLIQKVCKDHVGGDLTGFRDVIDSIIDHLDSQQNQAHAKAIQAVHADFADVIGSPAFESYRAAQTPAEQQDIERVVASGSSQEIIDMLNKFKQATAPGDGGGGGGDVDAAAIDAAEGVRSGGGLRIPDKKAGASDYEDAWNEF